MSALLGLARELRDLVYAELFRTMVFDSAEPQYCREDSPWDPRLAILLTNRQIHAEASPLVLRHARVRCSGAKDMLRFLSRLSPVQIRQLRCLRVGYTLFSFELPSARTSFMTNDVYEFNVTTLLGLFPGLQLDSLELYQPWHGWEDHGEYLGSLIGSLLEAEGFREVRVVLSRPRRGCPGYWVHTATAPYEPVRGPDDLSSWKGLIATRFRPRTGWSVDLCVAEKADTDNEYWGKHTEAGFTLWKDREARQAALGNQANDDGELPWSFRARRGAGPCMVPEGTNQVLKCVRTHPFNPKRAKRVSDYLKWLVKENEWAFVGRMGYDVSTSIHSPF